MLGAGRRMSRFVPVAAARMVAAAAAPRPSAPRFVRCFAAKPVPGSSTKHPDAALLKALKAEMQHEKGNEPRETKLKPPANFTMEDKPGMQEIKLHRKYGSEEISVSCIFSVSNYEDEDEPPQEPEDSENEEHNEPVAQEEVRMLVTISKAGDGPLLEVNCSCNQEEFEVDKVSYFQSKAAAKDTDALIYTGPDFDELEETLQDDFKKYLDVRGINEELCKFLINYMPEKERREYVHWLEKVDAFVRSS